jgi:LmbE family N-acetylglucosaminyl deacetylase
MIINGKMNVLCLNAHPDDLEIMAGGTIAKWINEGHQFHVLTFTDGVWTSPDGIVMRDRQEALIEENKAADVLGYTVENLQYQAMELKFQDKHVCEVLQRIDKLKIDTILCPWEKDLHHDHEVVSRIAMSASRRIPRLIMGQINFYLRDFFTPNLFVDISATWSKKIESLKCFRSEWGRNGNAWYEYLDETTRQYGRIIGVERAEGFVSRKFLL